MNRVFLNSMRTSVEIGRTSALGVSLVRHLARFLLAIRCCLLVAQPADTNRVLELAGDGAHVVLPAADFKDLKAGTVEGWVQWRYDPLHRGDIRFFGFGEAYKNFGVYQRGRDSLMLETRGGDTNSGHFFYLAGVVEIGSWVHFAAVFSPGGTKMFIDGELAATNAFPGGFAASGGSKAFYLGRSEWELDEGGPFAGMMDDVRVWSIERSAAEIRNYRTRRLTGNEPGLMAWWNFDAGDARDATGHGHDGKFVGSAHTIATSVPAAADLGEWMSVKVRVRDTLGDIPTSFKLAIERDESPDAVGESNLGEVTLTLRGKSKATIRVSRWDLAGNEVEGIQTNVLLHPGIQEFELTVPAAATLEGKVSDAEGRARAARISLTQGDAVLASVIAGSDGRFSVPVEPRQGRFMLRAEFGNLAGDSQPFSLTPGRQNVDLTMSIIKSVTGKALFLDGTPMEKVMLKISPDVSGPTALADGLAVDVFDLPKGATRFPSDGGLGKPRYSIPQEQINQPMVYGINKLDTVLSGSGFGVRFRGGLRVRKAGKYRFTLSSTECSRMFLDGRMLVLNLARRTDFADESSGEVELAVGVHPLSVDLVKQGRESALQLFWATDGLSRQIIPSEAFEMPSEQRFPEMYVPVEPINGEYTLGRMPLGRFRIEAVGPGGLESPDQGAGTVIASPRAPQQRDFHFAPTFHGTVKRWTKEDVTGPPKLLHVI
jgi:Concanavalin A-like lectin/glucanases superfamily